MQVELGQTLCNEIAPVDIDSGNARQRERFSSCFVVECLETGR